MADYKFYFSPGTCSRVSLIALEEIGVPFEAALIKFKTGEHKQPPYLQLHPRGKVPVLLVDGRPLTENLAILTYLAATHPDARLLPASRGAFDTAQALSELSWFASTAQPMLTRIILPFLFVDVKEAMPRVHAMGVGALSEQFALAEQRLASQPWLLGDEWSVVDAYLYWLWDQSTGAGVDAARFPNIAAHAARMAQRPAVRRAIQREADAYASLAAQGLALGPPVLPL
ncbi:MAG: glutathione S-transferase family protein [Steroidobacteraceae bacterium]